MAFVPIVRSREEDKIDLYCSLVRSHVHSVDKVQRRRLTSTAVFLCACEMWYIHRVVSVVGRYIPTCCIQVTYLPGCLAIEPVRAGLFDCDKCKLPSSRLWLARVPELIVAAFPRESSSNPKPFEKLLGVFDDVLRLCWWWWQSAFHVDVGTFNGSWLRLLRSLRFSKYIDSYYIVVTSISYCIAVHVNVHFTL